MKIVHLLWGLSTGGVENMLVDIVNNMVEGNDISIVVVNDMVDSSIVAKLDERIKLYFCGRKRKSKNPIPLIKLFYYLRKIRPEIIHTHYDGLFRYVRGPWKKVRTIHNTTNDVAEGNHYDACYAISRAVQNEWKMAGCDTILVENGICCSQIIPRNRVYDVSSDEIHFVQVSRLYKKQKGQDILLRALAKVKQNNRCKKKINMHFVGDGPDRERFQNMAAELGIGENVFFEGNKTRDWVYKNLCHYDLFIQPSRYEGFGLTVAEAMAARIPVLISRIEGPLEIITPHDNDSSLFGLTFESENVDDLAAKIEQFAESGADSELLDRARDHILADYDIKETCRRYQEEYTKVFHK